MKDVYLPEQMEPERVDLLEFTLEDPSHAAEYSTSQLEGLEARHIEAVEVLGYGTDELEKAREQAKTPEASQRAFAVEEGLAEFARYHYEQIALIREVLIDRGDRD